MPICRECGKMRASAEMRKVPSKDEYLCRDKSKCRMQRLLRTGK